MTKGVSSDLCHVLVLLLPLLGILDAESVRKDFSDGFQWHPATLRVAQHHEYPADGADAAVESKGAGGRQAFHHREEGGSNDDVCAPASDGIQHCANSSNFKWDQLSANPRNGCNTG